ncbi:MAG: hypothetical protein NTY90_05265 [Candidatus Micrarchaeota archaeon]|nr:hypothetical protein [Candidatus Micrarchaeota archaeon]
MSNTSKTNKTILAAIVLAASLLLFGCMGSAPKPVNETIASLALPTLSAGGGGAALGDLKGVDTGAMSLTDKPVGDIEAPSLEGVIPTVSVNPAEIMPSLSSMMPQAPSATGTPAATGAPTGAGGAGCSQFANIPSCAMAGAGAAMCKQCYPSK